VVNVVNVIKIMRFWSNYTGALLVFASLSGVSEAAQLTYTSYAFTTAAGIPGQAGYWDAPIGQAAVFHYPAGVAADTNGNIFVADSLNGVIRKLSPAGTNWAVSTIATNFDKPNALAFDNAGALYVASSNRTIIKLTFSGTNWVSSTLSTDYASLGIAVDGATNVYVNDGNAIIVRILPGP
jgi:hypothetical protein